MKIRTDFVTNSSSTGYVLVIVEMTDGSEYSIEREYDTGYGGYLWDGNTRASLNTAMKKVKNGEELLELLNKKVEYFEGFMIRDDYEGTEFKEGVMTAGSRDDLRSIRLEEETQYEDGSKKGMNYIYSFADDIYIDEFTKEDIMNEIDQEIVIIPEGFRKIGEKSFSSVPGLEDINKVECPSTLNTIGREAFSGCTGLKEIVLPNGLKLIEYLAFSDCIALKSISIPDGCMVSERAFYRCYSLANTEDGIFVYRNKVLSGGAKRRDKETLVIPEGIEEIDSGAFEGREGIREVFFPKSLKRIRREAFLNVTSLENIHLNSFIEIQTDAFKGCGIRVDILDEDTLMYLNFSSKWGQNKALYDPVFEKIKDNLPYFCEKMLLALEEYNGLENKRYDYADLVFQGFAKRIVVCSDQFSKKFFERANMLFVRKGAKRYSDLLVDKDLVVGDDKQEERKRKRRERARKKLEEKQRLNK